MDAHAEWKSGALVRRWLAGYRGAFVLVAVPLVVFGTGLVTCSRGGQPTEEGRVSLPSESNHLTQEDPLMRESKTLASSSSAPEVAPSTLDMDFMKSLAAAVCLVSAGCASVPVSPSWPQDCPQEALAAMSIRGFGPGTQGYVTLDINRPGALSQFDDFRAGPIVSGIGDETDAVDLLPLGTKLYGFMWTGGDKVHVYWTRAELPNGAKMPVCMVLGFDEQGGYWKEPGTQPGTFRITRQAPVVVTRRFERPE